MLTFSRLNRPDKMLIGDKTEHRTRNGACQVDDIFQKFNEDLGNN